MAGPTTSVGASVADARSLGTAGREAADRGELPLAERLLTQAVALARSGGQEEEAARLAVALGDALRRMNRYEEAVPHYMDSLTIGQVRDLPDLVIDSLRGLGYAHFRRGDVYGAEEYFVEGLERARAAKDRRRQLWLRRALADFYNESGEFTKAVSAYTDALELLGEAGQDSTVDRIHIQVNMGEVYVKLHNTRRAQSLLEEALAMAAPAGMTRFSGWASLYLARVHLQLQRPDTAAAMIDQAERALRGSADQLADITVQKLRAIVQAHQGDPAGAVASFAPVEARLHQLDFPLQLVESLCDMAEALIAAGAMEQARDHLERARPIAQGLELTALESRLESLQATTGVSGAHP